MSEREERTIAYYDTNPAGFARSVSTADMREAWHTFASYLPERAAILDLGCGAGRDTGHFLSCGYDVLPIDASREMCRMTAEACGIQAKQLRFEEIDFIESFDGVWACASLLHAEREKLPAIIAKISRALRPGGILFMSFKYGKASEVRNGRFFTDMTEEDVPFLCNGGNGLRVLECRVTEDSRPERKGERWLSVYAIKPGCPSDPKGPANNA